MHIQALAMTLILMKTHSPASQDEFNQQIRQDCLPSTDENECLVSRLNKINKVVLNDFVSRDVSLNDSCDDSINDSHNEP